MADGKDGEEALFKRIEALGLQLEYDSGFFAVTRSASADQRDDDGEVLEALFEQLGKHLPDVARIAVGKARCARAQAFVDRPAFVPSIQAFGTLKDCSAEGIVKIAYRRESFKDPEVDVDLVHSDSGADVLLVLDERPAPASKTSFTWIADERLRRLFERARAAGLTLAHDSGFTVVKWGAIAGVAPAAGSSAEVVEGIIRELGAKLGEVSARLTPRVRGQRGRDFVGRRVFLPDFNAFGILASSSVDGGVTVTYVDPHMKSKLTCRFRGDDLLFVPDKRATAEPAAGQDPENRWARLMRRLFGS